ncbi:MAG: hypothetical protein RR394_02735 [Oscillospiraceae bacterium]
MIKIIQGVYGHYTGRRVEPKDKNSEPFELTSEEEARLVGQGVAVYVDEPAKTAVLATEKSVDEMNNKELRSYGETLGLKFKPAMKNADIAEAIKAHLAEAEKTPAGDGTGEGQEGEGEQEPAPTFNPAEAVQ